MPRRSAIVALFFALCSFFCVLLVAHQVTAAPLTTGLDSGFGERGVVRPNSNGLSGPIVALVQQPDGKIVAAGEAITNQFTLLRLSPDGVLDSTFGNGGFAQLKATGRYAPSVLESSLALQSDGKIVVAGCNSGSQGDILLARFLSNGAIDETFGQLGVVSTDLSPAGYDCAQALIIDSDGKLVIAGRAQQGGRSRFMLARYLPNGSLDPSFGTAGLIFPFDDQYISEAFSLTRDASGALVAAGQSCELVESECDFSLVRVSTDGVLDPTFGQGGVVKTRFGPGRNTAWALVMQPDGKLVAAGGTNYTNLELGDVALARYLANGNLDPSFGDGGLVTTDIEVNDTIRALELDPLGRIVVAGNSFIRCTGCGFPHGWVARYSGADGGLDRTFGGTGVVNSVLNWNNTFANALLIQPSGRIIVAGSNEQTYLLVGYETSPDPTVLATRTVNPLPTANTTVGPVPVPTGPPVPVICTLPFTDVVLTDYYYAAVLVLYCSHTISGYSDNTFRPGNPVTRAQLAKFVMSSPPDTRGGPHFTDVPPSNPFYQYIETLYNSGIISGYDGPTPDERLYHPGAYTTRAQVSKVLTIAAGWTPLTNVTPHFSDVSPNDPFFGYIESARAHRVISGYADGTFRPGVATTRGQLAKMMYVGDYLSTQATNDSSR